MSFSIIHQRSSWLLAALLLITVFSLPARADFGPKPNDRQEFEVTFEGNQLSDARFVAAMLEQTDQPLSAPNNMGALLPGLTEAVAAENSGQVWTYADYRWGGSGVNGRVDFNGFYGQIPKSFRLAVFLPSMDKVFLTNEVKTHPLLTRYKVNLSTDEMSTLQRDESGRWIADRLIALTSRGMPFALTITLALELAVVVVMVLAKNKRECMKRMLMTCLGMNLITLPALWVICLVSFWMFGLRIGLMILLIQELIVVLIEAGAYATIGRLGWKPAVAVSLAANATSFFVGLALG